MKQSKISQDKRTGAWRVAVYSGLASKLKTQGENGFEAVGIESKIKAHQCYIEFFVLIKEGLLKARDTQSKEIKTEIDNAVTRISYIINETMSYMKNIPSAESNIAEHKPMINYLVPAPASTGQRDKSKRSRAESFDMEDDIIMNHVDKHEFMNQEPIDYSKVFDDHSSLSSKTDSVAKEDLFPELDDIFKKGKFDDLFKDGGFDESFDPDLKPSQGKNKKHKS